MLTLEGINRNNNLVDLSVIPSKYYKFTNVFSKTKAKFLTFYYSYNFQINLEGVQLPVSIIYSLSSTEQETFKEFINKNLNTRFI